MTTIQEVAAGDGAEGTEERFEDALEGPSDRHARGSRPQPGAKTASSRTRILAHLVHI
jgi:hypothetical protein